MEEFIDYFGQSIESDPSSVGKNNIYFSVLGVYQDFHL